MAELNLYVQKQYVPMQIVTSPQVRVGISRFYVSGSVNCLATSRGRFFFPRLSQIENHGDFAM